MVSFLRKKSFNGGSKVQEEVPAMPTPAPEIKSGPLEMPDLRFSKLDFDIDVNKIGGFNSRPGSVQASHNSIEPKRKSKMNFLNFGSDKESTGEMNSVQLPRLAMIADESTSSAGSFTDLADMRSSPPRKQSTPSIAGSTRPPPSIASSSPNRNRKILVASATEAMKLDVPVQAPSRNLLSQMPTAEKTKKDIKREEKEQKLAMELTIKENIAKEKVRAAREKEETRLENERAKAAIKQAKEQAKKEKELARRMSKKQDAASTRPILADTQESVMNGQGESKSIDGSVVPSSRPKASGPPSEIGPVGGKKSAPPSVINGRATAGSPQKQPIRSQGPLPTSPTANGPARAQYRTPRGGPSAKENVPVRSQSTVPAADGIARPVVNRGQTLASEKPIRQQVGSFGASITDSPLTQQASTSQSRQIYTRGAQKIAAGSSSDEGGTSTTQEAPSMESNASYDGNGPDSPDTEDDRFVDAAQNITPQIPGYRNRPKRDEEREQKRKSLTLDGEISRVLQSMSETSPRESKDRFSALLMGGNRVGDRLANSNLMKRNIEESPSQRLPPPPPAPVKRVREVAPPPKRRNAVRPELVVVGQGWKCLGVGDTDLPDIHNRLVKETIKVPKRKSWLGADTGETEEQEVVTRYNDLFELLWTSTTPDVTSRLISHLQMPDLKALRQSSHSLRFALNVQENRETILNQFLAPIGYRSWSTIKGSLKATSRAAAATMAKDPCPLSFNDCEAFLIGHDLLPEYAAVGKEFAKNPNGMDPRMARLAQASTRAYSRVLTRLRLQPIFRIPNQKPSSSHLRADNLSSAASSSGSSMANFDLKHNSYYPGTMSPSPALGLTTDLTPPSGTSPTLLSPLMLSPPSPSESGLTSIPVNSMVSPWKPGRAAFYRVWVPARDPTGWLSDEEMTQCETELYKAGIWQFLKRGDVVWDTAVGDKLNEGKYIFDGHYLRDLSYAHDVAGHLPSWLNCLLYSPSYWHNIIFSSTPRPIIYFDISPWKDQIVSSLRLVQDHVEGYGNNGSRYRVAKWLYRCGASITSGQIVSKMNSALEIVDEGWSGKIIIETEGTAEHAKALVSRCAGPNATPQAKAMLLAAVMGDATAARKMLQTTDSLGLNTAAIGSTPQRIAMEPNGGVNGPVPTKEIQNSAWMIMRERSRPGLIWIKLASERSQ